MRRALLVAIVALLALPGAADAAFPGQNGRLVFGGGPLQTMNPDGSGTALLFADSTNLREAAPSWSPAGDKVLFERMSCSPSICFGQGIWVVNADGSGLQQIPNVPSNAFQPAWAPDGQRFVYAGDTGSSRDLYAIGLDGTNEVRLTNVAGHDSAPAWSPDGSKIVFTSPRDTGGGPDELYVMNADGSAQTRLTTSTGWEMAPNWSPDGSRIVFEVFNPGRVIWSIKPAGTDLTPLSTSSHFLGSPAWSPDGSKIAMVGTPAAGSQADLFLMNPDGSGLAPITNDAATEADPDWQPLPTPYPRPKGATPVRVSLVPAYRQCTAPDRTHGPPLAFGSCSAPAPESGELTTGTVDSNGVAVNMTGVVRYETVVGNPSTPEDEADIGLRVEISDVRDVGTLADYTGEVEARANARLTDRTGPGGVTATTVNVLFPLTTQCTPTANTSIGATCSLTTTLDTLIPGAIAEGRRTVMQLSQVQVTDGGTDGDTATEPNTIFLRQGVFVP